MYIYIYFTPRSKWERLSCMRHFEKHSRRDMPARKSQKVDFLSLEKGCLRCPRKAWRKWKLLAGSPGPGPARTHAAGPAGPARSQRALPGLPPAVSEADAPEERKRDTWPRRRRGALRPNISRRRLSPDRAELGDRMRGRRESGKVGSASNGGRSCSLDSSLCLTS